MGRGRLRDLGITTGLLPTGQWNAITDVAGVKVGVATLITNSPHIVRTGVTAIWPRGPEIWQNYCFAGTHSFNSRPAPPRTSTSPSPPKPTMAGCRKAKPSPSPRSSPSRPSNPRKAAPSPKAMSAAAPA